MSAILFVLSLLFAPSSAIYLSMIHELTAPPIAACDPPSTAEHGEPVALAQPTGQVLVCARPS